MKSTMLILACVATAALAACPNKCSGHGTCGKHDYCTCEPKFTGADCAQRQCAYGLSWTAEKGDTDIIPGGRGLGGHRAYTECSSKGTCNRGSGLCECFEGFTGSACRRTTCLNDCSGHGRCLTLRQTNSSYVAYHAAQFSSQYWNANMTRRCSCDEGWNGRDCSGRRCPKGNDPMTDCDTHKLQVQRIYVVHKSSNDFRCRSTGASQSTATDSKPPGLSTYSRCYYGKELARDEGSTYLHSQTTKGTKSLASAATTHVRLFDNSEFNALTEVPYLTVFDGLRSVGESNLAKAATDAGFKTFKQGRTFSCSAYIDASGTTKKCTIDTDVHGAVGNGGRLTTRTGLGLNSYDLDGLGFIIHSQSGFKGTPVTQKMCPKGGPYAYQDQTDGKYASALVADIAKRGCEADDPSASSVGGHQLGYIALTYTDMFGSRFTTRPILIDSTAAATQSSTSAAPTGQFIGTKMSAYNGCVTASDCRGWPSSTITCPSTKVCTDSAATLLVGGSHPYYEGPAGRSYALTTAETTALSGTSLGSGVAGKIRLKTATGAGTGTALANVDDYANNMFIEITDDADVTDVGVYEIDDFEFTQASTNTYDVTIGRFISGVNMKGITNAFSDTGNTYKIFRSPQATGNYDGWRTPERLLFTADRIRQALQQLPNFAIPQVNVTNHQRLDKSAATYVGNIFDVTFTHNSTAGEQPLLECIYNKNYNKPGAWPKMANTASAVSDTAVESCIVQDIYMGTRSYNENSECSNRGTCDSASGSCTCWEGFTGESCHEQTIFF